MHIKDKGKIMLPRRRKKNMDIAILKVPYNIKVDAHIFFDCDVKSKKIGFTGLSSTGPMNNSVLMHIYI